MKKRVVVSCIPSKASDDDIADALEEIAKSIREGNVQGIVGCSDIEWRTEDDK